MKRTVMIVTLAVASCAQSSPSEDEYNDVAQAIGSTASTGNGGGEIGSFADSARLAVGQMPSGLTLAANGHVTGDHFGLDYDYQLSCVDAAGQAQTSCGATTDAANVTLSWSGALDVPNLSASVERTGDWTLSDIQSGSATFEGEGTFTFDISVTSIFRPVTSTYHLDYDAQYRAVVLDSAYRPVGGSIHYSVSAQHTVTGTHAQGEGSFEVEADVVFNADHTASVTLDGSHKYRLDLATGLVSRS
jgi:hypothetical protein